MQAFICAIYSFRGLHSNYYNITISLLSIRVASKLALFPYMQSIPILPFKFLIFYHSSFIAT